jgi:hypothetical protein
MITFTINIKCLKPTHSVEVICSSDEPKRCERAIAALVRDVVCRVLTKAVGNDGTIIQAEGEGGLDAARALAERLNTTIPPKAEPE